MRPKAGTEVAIGACRRETNVDGAITDHGFQLQHDQTIRCLLKLLDDVVVRLANHVHAVYGEHLVPDLDQPRLLGLLHPDG